MTGFGSSAKPYVEMPFAGRIIEVHWRDPEEPPPPGAREGSFWTNWYSGKWFSTGSPAVMGISKASRRFGFTNPVGNTTIVTYTITVDIRHITAGYQSFVYSGDLHPGESFIVVFDFEGGGLTDDPYNIDFFRPFYGELVASGSGSAPAPPPPP